ncbi:MAG: hypothetical protein NC548_31815 [Lachnospiraceae bacterium]|nr:hypothetical protein [Lachnospiraceae bacterium]
MKYGVSTHDVARVLGSVSLDVGTLCTASNINMWAKFKPYEPEATTPRPITNERRKADQYGLIIPIRGAAQVPYGDYGLPVVQKWEHNYPRTWKRLTDFVGDTPETEGYCHGATAPVSAEFIGNTIRFTFGKGTDGGIAPADFQVNSVGVMTELFYGYVIFSRANNGTFTPLAIHTPGAVKYAGQTGHLTEYAIEIPDEGIYYVYAVLSPVQYLNRTALSGKTHNIAYIHNAWTQMIVAGSTSGTLLFSRRSIDPTYFTQRNFNISDLNHSDITSGVLPDYLVTVLANTNGASLVSTSKYAADFSNGSDPDNRLAMCISIVGDRYDGYGLGDYYPVTQGITSVEDFNEICRRTLTYGIAQWDDMDGMRATLALRYTPISQTPDGRHTASFTSSESQGSTSWKILYRRSLVLIEEGGSVVYEQGINFGSVVITGNQEEVTSRDCTPITRIRFGNTVNGNNRRNGVQFEVTGEDGEMSTGVLTGETFAIYVESTGVSLGIFPRETEIGISGLPVQTKFYLDFSVDTLESQLKSLGWLE